ncbi:putative sensor histidine kinase/response regulator [Aspergillus aculeatinus CBS 121060]|uniref:Sensor histidine kinase/response regulator n=1 Tax=Aspergillus aculeatinus CBS 121060 TaxID=1448322 RepID=A0ACD1GV74_9EURO|nr:sensor histidine kinase/response regulator [Aspergillus aculeatinus CBS 121060]RAH65171.1 sensor histidine kinase/response regulator [Aspergillus aculeatinus CBS 121060]
MESSPPPQRGDDHNAGRRVRELYRYFQPERTGVPQDRSFTSASDDALPSASLDSSNHIPSSPSLSSHSQCPSNPAIDAAAAGLVPESLIIGEANATLTSFAQLAALRLNVERVLISVSDRQSQFILAQSTQTGAVSDYQASGEGVWDGCSTLSSSAWSMCKVGIDSSNMFRDFGYSDEIASFLQATVALPPAREPGQRQFLILNDLSEEERYKRLPFVAGEPQFRFYAGTPLTTDTNINIGCFFVLDTKPHDGFSATERGTMDTLAGLIMDYLKVSRQASEGRRAARLSRGLSCFVEGSSSFVDGNHPSSSDSSAAAPSTPPSSSQRANHHSLESLNSFDAPSRRSQSSDTRSFSSVSESKFDHAQSSAPDTPFPDWWAGSREKELKGSDDSHGHGWAFRRAANLLRESLELSVDGGVIFVEANNSPMIDVDTGSDCSIEGNNPAPVLAISTSEEPFAPGPGSKALYPAASLDTAFLHQLLRRYSKGKLWSFHRDGMISSSDDETPRRSRSRTTRSSETGKTGSKRWRATENSMLNQYFPNATQVLFVPLWNSANSQWFAGCFCWNTLETQVFSSSVELSSILGFGSSIMAECNRVESLISDRQKGDFIGSISHELRSPLHGILAAAEFLNATQLDEFQTSLLETINACGRTLLDTMNQVLDFSKIVSLERTYRNMKRSRTPPTELKGPDRFSTHLDTYVATDLALLAEEVVEGVCLGHAYGQKSSAPYDQPMVLPLGQSRKPASELEAETACRSDVEVVVDIAHNDWTYLTQPGALRRIIMNVFGNAMKYTHSGRVSLHLEVTEASEGRSRRHGVEELVTLTVSDTGKGISEEFLRGRLYTPFAQEDTLAVGTGLGLSIVRSLVKALKGSINIHSRPGEGTIVKVSLPLIRPGPEVDLEETVGPRSPSAKEKDALTESRMLREAYAGRRVAVLGVEPAEAVTHSFWSVYIRYLTDWYGLEIVSSQDRVPADITLAEEQDLASGAQPGSDTTLPCLLVFCNKSVDYTTSRSRWLSLANMVNIIRRPCGPHKLARSIRKCLEIQNGTLTAKTIRLPERPRPAVLTSSDTSPGERMFEIPTDTPDLTPEATAGSDSSSSYDYMRSQSSDAFDPLCPTESPASSVQPQSPRQQPDFLPFNRRARILVVDDNSINLKLMLTFMKKRELETLDSAENGKLAVDAVERLPEGYDIIFMDMSMPVMNGFEATRAIRAIEKERGEGCAPAVIIALTGLSSSRDESEALTSGVNLFLTKPVSFKEVSKLLSEWEDKETVERRLSGSESASE